MDVLGEYAAPVRVICGQRLHRERLKLDSACVAESRGVEAKIQTACSGIEADRRQSGHAIGCLVFIVGS